MVEGILFFRGCLLYEADALLDATDFTNLQLVSSQSDCQFILSTYLLSRQPTRKGSSVGYDG
jgi:hypothetical protein